MDEIKELQTRLDAQWQTIKAVVKRAEAAENALLKIYTLLQEHLSPSED